MVITKTHGQDKDLQSCDFFLITYSDNQRITRSNLVEVVSWPELKRHSNPRIIWLAGLLVPSISVAYIVYPKFLKSHSYISIEYHLPQQTVPLPEAKANIIYISYCIPLFLYHCMYSYYILMSEFPHTCIC